jgi:hypothetical protein
MMVTPTTPLPTAPITVPSALGTPTAGGHDWIDESPADFHAESAEHPHHAFIKVLVLEGSPGDPLVARLWITPAWFPSPFQGQMPNRQPDAVVGLTGFNGGPTLAGIDDWIDLGVRGNFEAFWLQAYYYAHAGERVAQGVQHRSDQYTNGYLSQVAFASQGASATEFVVGLAIANVAVPGPLNKAPDVPIMR